MSKLSRFFLYVCILLSSNLAAQDLIINYTEPNDLVVCDSNIFVFNLTNASPDTLQNITVTVGMPTGVNYILGSISAGTETNLNIPNAPVFEFPDILPFASIEFSINTRLQCALVSSINSGALFTNSVSATWTDGSNSITTVPYLIETPLLVITNTTNPLAVGTQGGIITREITIQNTRLGALSSFTFRDTHDGGIEITSVLGTVVNATDMSFELELTGNDFMTIGDGDALFEKDEVIVITEIVEVLDCGIEVPFTESDYSVSWSCFSEVCQNATNGALIDIIPSPENPDLKLEYAYDFPTDFCAQNPLQQSLTITNEGIYEAVDVRILLNLLAPTQIDFVEVGFDANSFLQTNGGVTTPITPIATLPNNTLTCDFPNDAFQNGVLTWTNIPAGETIIVTWDYFYCNTSNDCGFAFPVFDILASYLNHCPADTVLRGALQNEQNLLTNGKEQLRDSLYYNFGEPLLSGMNYPMSYFLKSSSLVDTGVLDLNITLPCGFSLGNNDFLMGGQSPLNFESNTDANGQTVVNFSYNLPMNDDSISTVLDVIFNCDPNCGSALGSCQTPFITASGELGCGTESEILVESTLQTDPDISLDCSMKVCRTITLSVECELDDFPIPGQGDFAFLLFNHDFSRCNFDFPDNDDDRLQDASGDLNFNLVRKDRTIPGDTVTNIFSSTIFFPAQPFPVSVDLMTVQFEAHTADAGLDGGTSLDFGLNGNLLGTGGITHLNATIRIVKQSTGEIFECEIADPFFVSDSIYQEFEVVNTAPEIPIDELLYNQFKYNTSFSNIPCLPAGFQYENGDSLIFTTKHRMVYNPRPQMADLPPVVNMRSAIVPIFCNDFNPFISAHPLVHTKFQYSGYRYDVLPDVFIASPCEPFEGENPIAVRFVLGMDNFFPFEYRPLATLESLRINFPNNLNVLSSKLVQLRYQGGASILENEDLSFTTNGEFYDYEVAQWHEPVLDEGWVMFFNYQFENDCSIENFDNMELETDFELNPCLPENPAAEFSLEANNFAVSSPLLNAGVTVANYTSFTDQAFWELVFINNVSNFSIPAENVWLTVNSATGLVSDFELVNSQTGMVVPITNGVFQLGTIDVNELLKYELTATNNSCSTETLNVDYGWNCEPYESITQPVCDSKLIILTATSPNGELELDVESPPGPFELCEVIDYHTAEIYNAQLGNVYDVILEATLPQGLSFLSGTSELAYPTGNIFASIPDPINIGGNIFQWDISNLNNLIQNNGLVGVSQSPDNSVSVRFQTTTDCGFIAGAQIVFNVKGKQNCDEPTNNLTKAAEPINIAGVNPGYTADINIAISSATSISCGVSVPLNINILPDGNTSGFDSVFISLPLGVSYVPGSYTPVNNAPTNPPTVFNNGGQEIIKVKLNPNIAANTLISFEIETTGYGATGCADQTVQVQAVQQQDATCTTTGELCYVLAQTGSASLVISSEHPDLSLQNFDLHPVGDSVNYEVTIVNGGIPNSSPVQVDFYVDNDGNGQLSAGDILVGSGIYSESLPTGENAILDGNFMLTSSQWCQLIAVIDEVENCVCSSASIPVSLPLQADLPDNFVCSGEEVSIGIPSENGHTYTWSPANNLSSSEISNPNFQAPNFTSDTLVVEFNLLDNNNEGCEISYDLSIQVLPVPSISQNDLEICAGETVTISATSGGTFNWSGPNISNPNQSSQTLTLFESATYSVNISTSEGCDAMDEINITVLPFQEDFSSLNKCANESVNVFGQTIFASGTYCDTLTNLTGCDSLICIEVNNFISETDEVRALCPGDSVEVNGIFYQEETMICNTFLSSTNCDSTHCVTIQIEEAPIAEFEGGISEIRIAENVETQLQVTEGFAQYEWLPTTGLSCTDCPNPTTTLTENIEYEVTVTDLNGCTARLVLLITVLPPCDPVRLEIPNAFTPDEDGVNDSFGVPKFEGFEMVSSIKIFNRWGEKVFEQTGEDAQWDGTVDGKPGTTDVYVYIIKITCSEGESELVGDVTLIR